MRKHAMKRLRSFINILLCLTILGCNAARKDKLLDSGTPPLTRAQLELLVRASTIRLESIDFDAKLSFHEDGRFDAESRVNETDSGKWAIDVNDRLCLKFSSWYYGDLRCYDVFEESAGKFAFFTNNGARAYSVTSVGARIKDSAPNASSQTKTVSSTDASNRNRQTLTSRKPNRNSSKEESRATFIRLAANCPGCNFADADLSNSSLVAANLKDANLSSVNLSGANLRRADLSGANLAGALLKNTTLAGANLRNANLENADLSGSNLIRADLTGAKYTTANFSGAYLEGIKGYITKP